MTGAWLHERVASHTRCNLELLDVIDAILPPREAIQETPQLHYRHVVRCLCGVPSKNLRTKSGA
jgi:hypothetical protein